MVNTTERLPGAVVTGTSRGIGAAIALRFARLGYGVCVDFVHSANRAESVVETIEKAGGRALELAPRITVNAVSPGYTRTDMTRAALERGEDKIVARIPAHRIAEPNEIAAPVALLASEDAGYITGETINANGGIYMQ